MATKTGVRLEDTRLGDFPLPYDDMPPGAYWRVLDRKAGEPLKPDAGYWGTEYPETNLTGTVWGIITPLGQYGMLSVHTVREHDDGTISVRPGDGSSNSILVTGSEGSWHGYIDYGEWYEC